MFVAEPRVSCSEATYAYGIFFFFTRVRATSNKATMVTTTTLTRSFMSPSYRSQLDACNVCTFISRNLVCGKVQALGLSAFASVRDIAPNRVAI